jgi:hypothetical protein
MIVEALISLRPGAKWSLNGDTLAGLEWVDEQPRPSDAEIQAEAERLWLPTRKAELSKQVDEDAERIRLRYITPGAGMAMTYAEKRDQANAVHGLGQAAANALTEAERVAQFPTLAASVGIEGSTLWDCAQLVIAKSEAWADLSNVIERTRLLGKKSISDASDAASARAAYEAIAWTV